MNKEEILRRSQQENANGDERVQKIRVDRDAFSVWAVELVGAALMAVKLARGQSPADIVSIFFAMAGAAFAYEGGKLKSKSRLIAGGVLLALGAYFFYRFCAGVR